MPELHYIGISAAFDPYAEVQEPERYTESGYRCIMDAKAVARYAEQMKNAEYAEAFAKDARQGADEHPVLHNAASVVSNALNLPAALDYGKQWARNTFTDDYAPIDVNTPEQLMGLYRDTVRDETGKNIEESLGGGFGGKAASFVYQTGMSWADSLANMAMSGGNAALSGVLMGSGAMASTVRSAKEKGASDSQAMGAGIAAGFFEGRYFGAGPQHHGGIFQGRCGPCNLRARL